jgi:hypothetical protein
MKHPCLHCALSAALFAAAAPPAWSQSTAYPSKVVRLIVPVAPGGNQDIIARAVAEPLARALGQQVVIESRPGVSATVGTRFVKSAPADGHTLLTISNTFVRTPAVMADAGYDPLQDFVAISQTADVPLVLVVNPALPVKTVQEQNDPCIPIECFHWENYKRMFSECVAPKRQGTTHPFISKLQTAAAPHGRQDPLIFIVIAQKTIVVQPFLVLQVVVPILFKTVALGCKFLIGDFFNSFLRDQLR